MRTYIKWILFIVLLMGFNLVIPQTLDSTRNKTEQTQEINQFPKDSLSVSGKDKKRSPKTKVKQTLGALGVIVIITIGSYLLFYTRSKG